MPIERGELIDRAVVGVGAVTGVVALGLEAGSKFHEVLMPQAPLLESISLVAFLVSFVALSAAMLREFPRLHQIAREAERASQFPPTLSNGPQSL